MHSQSAQFGRLHLKTLLDVLIFCSVNFALVISLFKFELYIYIVHNTGKK